MRISRVSSVIVGEVVTCEERRRENRPDGKMRTHLARGERCHCRLRACRRSLNAPGRAYGASGTVSSIWLTSELHVGSHVVAECARVGRHRASIPRTAQSPGSAPSVGPCSRVRSAMRRSRTFRLIRVDNPRTSRSRRPTRRTFPRRRPRTRRLPAPACSLDGTPKSRAISPCACDIVR